MRSPSGALARAATNPTTPGTFHPLPGSGAGPVGATGGARSTWLRGGCPDAGGSHSYISAAARRHTTARKSSARCSSPRITAGKLRAVRIALAMTWLAVIVIGVPKIQSGGVEALYGPVTGAALAAVALSFVAWLVHRGAGTSAVVAGWCFVAGVGLFSGSLYLMTITGQTKLGAITPFGGLLLLVGWGAVVVAGWRLGAGS